MHYKLVTKNDSTFIEVKSGDDIKKYSYPGEGMMHLGINSYYFYYPLIGDYAPTKIGELIRLDFIKFLQRLQMTPNDFDFSA
jgi:hypothetical protein